MNRSKVPKDKIIQILDLYYCSTQNGIKTISLIVGYSKETISRVINDYFLGKIKYERPNNLLILHSSINTEKQ